MSGEEPSTIASTGLNGIGANNLKTEVIDEIEITDSIPSWFDDIVAASQTESESLENTETAAAESRPKRIIKKPVVTNSSPQAKTKGGLLLKHVLPSVVLPYVGDLDGCQGLNSKLTWDKIESDLFTMYPHLKSKTCRLNAQKLWYALKSEVLSIHCEGKEDELPEIEREILNAISPAIKEKFKKQYHPKANGRSPVKRLYVGLRNITAQPITPREKEAPRACAPTSFAKAFSNDNRDIREQPATTSRSLKSNQSAKSRSSSENDFTSMEKQYIICELTEEHKKLHPTWSSRRVSQLVTKLLRRDYGWNVHDEYARGTYSRSCKLTRESRQNNEPLEYFQKMVAGIIQPGDQNPMKIHIMNKLKGLTKTKYQPYLNQLDMEPAKSSAPIGSPAKRQQIEAMDTTDNHSDTQSISMVDSTTSNFNSIKPSVDKESSRNLSLEDMMKIVKFCNESQQSFRYENDEIVFIHDLTKKEIRFPASKIQSMI
ncbi:unnamed protein product [Bursaphelenchus okinawaensis]|uniref:Uncharacterized protein n=1 Tax=Bursaphelenchus okinawaensis TaxID=465554 RepID=A0A811KSM4_9BILA|nr:unnamed protein product [Bursaphelenchus okinawaensis]CAG9111149.1 unnamed protein product [Bursaphelenchus okinawaensis]